MQALKFDTESGIKAASYSEIREALQADFKRVFGSDMNLAPSTPDGMLIDIFCYAFNALAQNLQGVATNLNVATASGVFLDYLAEIAVGGRNTGETDEQLIKRIQGAEHYGYATYNGMLTYLKKNIGTAVGLLVNEEDKTDANGVPPHRFAVYVPEGSSLTNNQIAGFIWECKPAGIKSHGTESGTASAADGSHTVYFSRISAVPAYFRIYITEYTEEVLPDDYAEQIRAAVAAWALTEYTPGKDIILKRVCGPVFSIPGILDVEVFARLKESDPWSDTNRIAINGSNYASVPAANIEVLK